MSKHLLLLYLLLLTLFPASAQINWRGTGKQFFYFDGHELLKKKPLKVWYYSPSNRPDTLPIVFMMHGSERNSSNYLDQWIPAAALFKCVVVAPEFSKEDYPGTASYNLGNVYDEEYEVMLPQSVWTFSMIEPLFRFVQKKTGNRDSSYNLYGHSAGAQFVHRFLYFVPGNHAKRVVAANAGSYTLPDSTLEFPYGLAGTVAGSSMLPQLYNREVFLLIGEADTSNLGPNFFENIILDQQGGNRVERGKYFYQFNAEKAKQQNLPFNWRIITVPRVGHSNKDLSRIAAALFTMNIR